MVDTKMGLPSALIEVVKSSPAPSLDAFPKHPIPAGDFRSADTIL
jgi:hypothetical protein